MKKGIIFTLLIVFGVLVFTKISLAAKLGVDFGGLKILKTKAVEIEVLERAGFTCAVPGTSVTILPEGKRGKSPTSYLIPASVKAVTKTTPTVGQKILGLFSKAKTTITCTKPCPPAVCTTTVQLSPIIYFGTSKK